MKTHLYEVRNSLVRSIRELAAHRVREVKDLGIAREKNTPVKVLIRLMADEVRRISRVPEVGPIRPVISGNQNDHE